MNSLIKGMSRWTMPAMITAFVVSLIALIVVSPVLLRESIPRAADWRALSDVGQAYGGISAVLSGLAFCGIAGSLFLQWRQMLLAQAIASRQRHFDLVKVAFDDTDMMFPLLPEKDPRVRQRFMYLNLWMVHWSMLWEMRQISEADLRLQFSLLLADPVGREWWAEAGSTWEAQPIGRRKSFLRVADEVYRAAADGDSAKSVAVGDDPAAQASEPLPSD
jgi:hypothetical protein